MLYRAELLRPAYGYNTPHLNPAHVGLPKSAEIPHPCPIIMGLIPGASNSQLNIVISAWICIASGSGLILYGGSDFLIALSAPLSIGGVILLILGISMGGEENSGIEVERWQPVATEMPDAGRPMYRIDTTLDDPIRTSVLCGRCAEITWTEGKKPNKFICPSCETLLWDSEEE